MASVNVCDVCKARGRLIITSRFWRFPRQGRIDVCNVCDGQVRARRHWKYIDLLNWMKAGAPLDMTKPPEIKYTFTPIPGPTLLSPEKKEKFDKEMEKFEATM